MGAAVSCVRVGEPVEGATHLLASIPHRFVTTDEIGIGIDEHGLVPMQATGGVQVEEHGAAAEKRLDVPVEPRRVEPSQLREELTFAAGPLQQRANRAIG